ncbi:hypothetical protein L1987_15976 [Smallanthus sonchifolius]|uniref:Uncharacterized protein n=1 Tax=Smallanthus sonchifolius TaxID=185202 RepID=A0ACB9J8L0_9ASTR|nr:hypothetical protein L1987_15976 [Smallanthus sonchifolius]
MDMLFTTNPLDIHHILTKNFSNYPKGDNFRKIFDILGDGIFNSDGELWETHRKTRQEDGFAGYIPKDTICKLLLDHDPKSLSLDFPYIPYLKAFSHAEKAILYRHVTPSSFWKLQKLLGVGNEKMMSDAWKTIDQFIYSEIGCEIECNRGEMVYLHGALSGCLRLFPPLPFNHKSPLQPDILPSGHQVDQSTKIILCFYSMGKMKSIWGEDCMEFKPERWVAKRGGIKHEPSYKIPAFNAGPRTCVGKDMALYQVKIVATMVIYHYHIEPVEDHLVLPEDSTVLQMKHGLKVRVTKRTAIN